MPEYAEMCLNMPISAWMTLLLISKFALKSEGTWGCWRHKVWFFIEPGSICFAFCYRVNSFVRFQICCYLSGAMNLDILWQDSEALLTCITFYIIIFESDILFRSIKKMFSIF